MRETENSGSMQRKSFSDVLGNRGEAQEPKGIRREDDVLVKLWMTRNENLLRQLKEGGAEGNGERRGDEGGS